MKKSYLLVPAFMLAGFVGFERDYSHSSSERNQRLATEVAAANAAETVRLETLREKVTTDAKLRHQTREAREREGAAEKLRTQAAALRAIEAKADTHVATADSIAGESEVLERELAAIRTRHEALNREAAESIRQLDAYHASRRAAELALQQTMSRFAARLHETIDSIEPPPARQR